MSETRFLPVKLSPEEIQVIKNKVADLAVDMITWEVSVSSLKKKIGAAKEEQNVHALKLANGNEICDIECEWDMNPNLNFKKGDFKGNLPYESLESRGKWEDTGRGTKCLVRMDSGLIVEEEPMEPEDFQGKLDMKDEEVQPAKKRGRPKKVKTE